MQPSARVQRLAWIAGAAILVVLLVVAAKRIDLERLVATLRTVHAPWLIGALGFYVAILPLWALQWRVLAPQTDRNTMRRMLGLIAITSSAHNTTPMLGGEATSVLLLVTRIGLSRSAALSVLAMDQLLVGIAKLLVLATAALALSLPRWMSTGVAVLAVSVAALLAGTMLGAWHYESIALRAERFLLTGTASTVQRLGQALAPLRSPLRGGGALALALIKKLAEILAIVCVQRAFGISLPLADAVLVLAALNLATLLPLVPANLGVYEGTVAVIYTYLGIPTEQAVGMGVVQHACYFAALALPGYAWLAGSGLSRSAAATS